MTKALSILILIVLICKIFSSTRIEMKDLKPTNVLKFQPKPKLNNFLIFPSNDKFKYEILPFLSSKHLIKIYLYFRNLYPELNFENFLPHSRFYTTNIVLDAKEPIYLQEFENQFILYQFQNEYSFLQPPILYSEKNTIPIIFEPSSKLKPLFLIPSGSICLLLSSNKIIPYETYVLPNFGPELLILRNDQNGQFFVTFQTINGQFMNIAGGKVSKIEFHDYVECVWEAYNLQSWEKIYLKLKYILTIPCLMYVKYLLAIEKIRVCVFSHVSEILCSCERWSQNFDENNYWVKKIICLGWLWRNLDSVIVLTVAYIASFVSLLTFLAASFFVGYHTIMLPFFVLAFPLKFFIFGFNFCSFLIIEKVLATLYICFFPQIRTCLIFNECTLEDILNSFEIKPKKIMSTVPFLIQKRQIFWEYFSVKFLCHLVLNLLVGILIFLFGFVASVPFILTHNYF